jgi:hypothetical protein
MAAIEVLTGVATAGANFNLSLLNGLGIANYPVNIPSLINTQFVTSVGVAGALKVNQIYSAYIALTAASAVDFDLYLMGGATDPVGNAYACATVKYMAFQNLGQGTVTNGVFAQGATQAEGDTINIYGDGTTAAFTSFLSTSASGIILPSPVAQGSPSPVAIFHNPGSVGWVVGASTTNHKLQFLANTANQVLAMLIVGATA